MTTKDPHIVRDTRKIWPRRITFVKKQLPPINTVIGTDPMPRVR